MKILNRLTIEHLKHNKHRTVVTIIGIILSTALMVGIGLLFSTLRDNAIKTTKEYSGSHHVSFEMSYDKIDELEKQSSVKEYSYTSKVGYALVNDEDAYESYYRIISADNNYLEGINLFKGRLPKNENEIIVEKDASSNLKINDTVKMEVGKRVDLEGNDLNDTPLQNEYKCDDDGNNCELVMYEKLTDLKEKEYKVVGIYTRTNYSNTPGFLLITNNAKTSNVTVYVEYKNPSKAYDNTDKLLDSLDLKLSDKEIKYNDSLLGYYGVSKYSNITDSMSSVMAIVLGLISIACIIVIYNSFAISVMERKKQFGLFSSIETTKKQLRYTVFFEAMVVGTIGIVLGIISAYIGIGLLLLFINSLLSDIFGTNLALATYPIFIIIPIIFMIITILVSAFIPATMASRVSPIMAIRQSDDIKIKGKKLKTPFYVKWFGIEGELAYKNMKRNKKKYRITIISLFISIVLFVVFSALMEYGFGGIDKYADISDYNYSITLSYDKENAKDAKDIVKKVLDTKTVEEYSIINDFSLNAYVANKNIHSDKFKEFLKEYNLEPYGEPNVSFKVLDDESYNKYKKELGLKEDKYIVLNNYSTFIYKNNERKQVEEIPFNKLEQLNIVYYSPEKEFKLDNIYFADKMPFGIEHVDAINIVTIVVNEKLYNSIAEVNLDEMGSTYFEMVMKVKDDSKIDELFDEKNDSNILSEKVRTYTLNIEKAMQMTLNLVLVVKVLFYGFISLVTLIGVTSVINTINTSMALRRREFAVLRSIGLTPRGFNRMLIFECLLFGIKSLLYALPVSIGLIFLIHKSVTNLVTFNNVLIPYKSILIVIVGVFAITGLCMWYATSKIKKENILETIRNENI